MGIPGVDQALNLVQQGVCAGMAAQADAVLLVLESFETLIVAQLEIIRNFLRMMSWSLPQELLDKINEVQNAAAGLIPDASDYDKLVEMAKSCNYLSQEQPDATALVNKTTGPLLDNANNTINSLVAGCPEFDAVGLFNGLLNMLNSKKIDIMTKELESILACMNSVCGMDIQGRLDRLNNFLSKCCLDGDGKLNMDSVLSSAGISDPNKRQAINDAKASGDAVTTGITDRASQGFDRVKSMTKYIPI